MNYKFINGIRVFAVKSKKNFLDYVCINKHILVAVNSEKVMVSDNETKDIINRNFGYPDGIGVVWALKRKGCKDVIKIAGCELWLDIIKKFYSTKTFYLVGGRQKVIHKTVVKLRYEFPKVNILNYRNGYLKNRQQIKDLIEDIREKRPDFVFIAMGSPRQELLMEEIQKNHNATYLGLGGSFDVYTGNVKRAPKIWINTNLEWAYRLIMQPTRIIRQINYVPFLIKLIFNKL
tara:strand:- start:129 stop:827 length:699 start_codon:yes stop_codon:yes gene_type:complete